MGPRPTSSESPAFEPAGASAFGIFPMSDAAYSCGVTMIMSSGRSGQIRTTNQVGGFDVELNVDAQASTKINPPGFSGPIQIYTSITVQYMPAPIPDTSSRGPSKPSGLHQSIQFALLDGKPMLISQSADPVTDRKVTLEVTATVLK